MDVYSDSRLYDAIDEIIKRNGMINIETDIKMGISSRQLRRLFEHYIGDLAKSFAKIVRFQSLLKAKPSSQSLGQNKVFFDMCYYDQALSTQCSIE